MLTLISPPAFFVALAIAAGSAAGEADGIIDPGPVMQWGNVIGYGIVCLLSSGLTWLVASKITTAVLREQNKRLGESVTELKGQMDRLSETIGTLYERINDGRQERSECELRAIKRYATRDELMQSLVQASANHREVMTAMDDVRKGIRESVAKVHGRVDQFADRVTRLEERAGIAT